MKETVKQHLHDLRRHVKQMRPEKVPVSGNTVEPQPSSSKSGCKLKKVPNLFPLVVQCSEKVPESGQISFVEPSCSKSSPEQDRHISFIGPQPRPEKSTCGLKRVPTPYLLPAIDTPQNPLEYISLAELQAPSTKSTYGLERVPTPFPRPAIDTPPQTPKSTDECTLGPLRRGLEQVPTLYPLPPAIDTTPQSPVEDNDNYPMDARRCAWYGPPDFFPNARRHQASFPAEPRYVRPMDLLCDGRSVVGVG